MTRVRLPPDPNSSCITTIVDSQGADSALLSAVAAMSLSPTGGATSTDSFSSFMQRAEASRISTATTPSYLGASTASVPAGGVENVDSIILVYDLDRVETFFRLENHWLPLIERCYNGEVNKGRPQNGCTGWNSDDPVFCSALVCAVHRLIERLLSWVDACYYCW
jgi:hypothetical protein